MKYRKKLPLYFTLIFSLLLGSYRGYIALWTSPSGTPDYVFPYSTASLPQADREALNKGIPVRSAQQLTQLLEDYLS